MKTFYEQLIINNRTWAKNRAHKGPDFFSATRQKRIPVMWIGCTDHITAPSEIIGMPPGDLYTYRNIANRICINDRNMQKALEYAVNTLKIRHVIVCGHYGCKILRAALANNESPMAENPQSYLFGSYKEELRKIPDPNARHMRFVELNVLEQLLVLCRIPIIQKSIANGSPIELHGWVFDPDTGLINDLGTVLKSKNEVISQLPEPKLN